ncbi:MBG domain-containing protein [Algoriphagus yeomjeoni]|uniref:Gliding motility-associated-like protein n=1 Tax=Algoriphagus yeomjeoni TaxID=291403 RepID=A0A327PA60_9BACT|nr:MBG domain-containing protein [Algoriphagus yeomjeoni]RAI88307.1 gliding motility-associated-like protein [Algoriphagus yeomjeoni]
MIPRILKAIFTVLLFASGTILSNAQTTVNFNSYTENVGLPSPHVEGELEFEAILGTSASCSGCIGIDFNEGKDNSPGLDDANFSPEGIKGWKISKADNSSFQFLSIWLQHRGDGSSISGTIKAFKGATQVGNTVNIDFNSSTNGLKSFSSNPDFYDVDEVRIEGTDLFIILDEITYGDPFVVGGNDPAEVTGINLIGAPLSTATSIQYQVEFSKLAKNVTADDFELTKTGTADGTIGLVTGSNATYTVPITGVSGEGTLRLDLKAGTDIANENDVTGTSAFTTGQVHNVSPCLVEDFEDETIGTKVFSYGGFNFTITGNLEVYTETPSIGINSSKNVLKNTGVGPYTISSNSGEINLSKIAFFLSSEVSGGNPTDDGSITVVGKNGGATVYTISKASGFPTDFSANSGYYIFDLETEGGVDNSDISVDEIEVTIGGAFQYINIDNFEFCADNVAPSGYSVTIDQDPITPDNDDVVSFTFAGAEIGTTYEYTFTSSGGGTPVTNTGTILTATDQITGIDLSGLGLGTITLTVNLTDASNNEGLPAQDQVQKRVVTVPVATPPTAPVVTEDDVNVALADDIQVTDADGDDQTLTFTITGGTVTLGTAGITFAGSGNGSASFTAAGTLAALNTALDAATFTPTPDLFGTNAGGISFVSDDGTATSDPASVTFDITGVNDAPVFDGNRVISYTEGGTAAKFNEGGNIVLSDVEGDNIIEAKITFNDKITGDVLSVEAPSPYSVTQEGDVITLSGTGSVAQMIAALESIEYSHTGNDPTVGGTDNSRNISILVKDASSLSSNSLVVQVSLTGINDDPTMSDLPSDISVVENTASNIDLSAATFGDVDSGSGIVRLSFLVSSGTLSATSGGGVTVTFPIPGAMNLEGTAAAIESFLNTPSNIQYTNALGSTGDNAATLSVSATDNGNTGDGGGTTVNLGVINIDVESFISFSINDPAVTEGNAGTTSLQFTVSLSAPAPAGGATVDYATSDGTATAGSDYTAVNGTLSFAVGETSKTVDISISGDQIVEVDETLTLMLSNPTGTNVTIVDASGNGTITNDDQAAVTIADVAVDENSGTATITVALDNAVDGGFDVDVSTADGTATTADSDYTAVTAQTLTFAGTAGETETFTITLGADTKVEADETVVIGMSNLVPGSVAGGNIAITDGATLTITNDDQATVTIADVSGNEDDGPITVTVTLDNAVDGGFNVDVSTADGTAVAGSDYTAVVAQTLTFAGTAGETETFAVTPTADAVTEPNESVSIAISGLLPTTVSSSAIDITDGATVTILNDDIDAPSKPDLVASSDSGVSDTDDITNDRTPTLRGTAQPNITIEIFSSVDGSLGETTSTDAGEWEFTPASELSPILGATAVSHDFTARAKDLSGNFSDSDPLTVVIDTKAPAPIIINGLAIQLDMNGNSPTLIASDFLASPITDDISEAADILLELDKNSFDCSNLGVNIIRVTATDEAGNSDYSETTVLVQDNILPIARAKNITLNVDAFGAVNLDPVTVDDGSSDNCSIVSRTLSKTEFTGADVGPNNVNLTVFDGSGSFSSAIAVVTVVLVPKVLTITADPGQSKLIGAVDPVFTYSASGFEGTDDETILTGALSRAAGETIGTYAINQGDLSAGPNYTINFVPADFEIKKGTLQITGSFNAPDKVYDATTASTISVNNLSLSGVDATVPDVSIGTVTTEFIDKNVGVGKEVRITSITLTGADAGSYDIDYTGAPTSAATISAAPISVVGFSSNNKVYDGTTIASLSGTPSVTGIGADDVSVTGTPIANFLQSNVGVAIPITVTGLTLDGLDKDNYVIIPPAGLEANITKAQLLITANPNQSKEFGSADPIFTYSSSGFVGGETDAILTGALSRAAGEDKGTYPINLGTLDAGSNYTINFTGADFTIASKVLNITADAGQMKVYGEADPIFTYVATGFEAGDNESILTGVLSRAAGENVGNYAINLGTLSAGNNYTINFISADFEITKRTLFITVNPNQAKVYGQPDPVFTYVASNFGNGDTGAVLAGALSRSPGENIGMYPINLGSLSAGGNYTINFTSADFEIAAKVLNIRADAGQSKVFGTTDPVFTYSVNGFENGDTNAILTGELVRAAGENVGSYSINLGTLSAGANYAINYVGANFVITKAVITGITMADGSFVYDGTAKSLAITGTLPTGTFVLYTNNSRTDVGTQEVTATISGSNYMNLVLMADLTITPASIEGITFEDDSFVYDGTAKSLAITGILPTGASVAYANNSRTDVGIQEVTATISGSNFTSFELTADLEITKAILEVIADADQSKLYGEADPLLTYSASGFGVGDDENILTGTLSRELGEGVGSYAITIGTLDAGANYTINFTGADFEIISNDTDGDGVPDDIEEEQGTDSEDPMDYLDTDGDGVPDYVEEQEGTDPDDAGDYLDSDDDLVPDYVEDQQGTDPEDGTDFEDEDGDGNPDYVQERAVTEFVIESMEALWGTDPGDLKLPTEVVVITAQGEFINLPVVWDLTGYDPLVSGTTNYLGTVDLPAGLFNPDDLQPMLEITVLTKPAPQDVTLSANSFIGIPDQYFQEIGAFTVIDPSDNVHMFSLPEGLEDNEYFEVLDGILFWSSAEQAGGRTTFTVVLQVTDRAGNVLEKSFLITRMRTPLDQLDVPNTFTPNGDGSNDTWGVLALRYYTGIRITILNVGGEVVFYTENPDVQWDGIFNGNEMPVGAYLYVIEVGETGEIRRGMLNLLRR